MPVRGIIYGSFEEYIPLQHAQNSARRNEDLSVPDVAHNEYNFVNEPIISKEGNCANALDDQDVDSSIIYLEFSHEVLVDSGAF